VTNDKEFETWFMVNNDYQMPEEDQKLLQQKLHEQRTQQAEATQITPIEV